MTDIASRWESDVLPSLSGLIEIPAVSPAYDPQWWEKGHLLAAAEHVRQWIATHDGLTAEVIERPGRTPLLFAEAAGPAEGGTVVIYGHLDKQPPLGDWSEGLGPWQPVVRDGRLYGRGSVDDGYAAYAAVTALTAGRAHARTVLLLETCEESGSVGLEDYLADLADRIGEVSLVICLDSMGLDYERLWMTTSLRGAVQATVTVRILDTPLHSGVASGIVPSSFRIMRQLLDRVEDSATGAVTVPEMNVPIPAIRREEAALLAALQPGVGASFPLTGTARRVSDDDVELLLNSTWRPTLSVIGAAGMPAPEVAGAVLRSATTLRLSFRTPPGVSAEAAAGALTKILTTDVPYGATVEVSDLMLIDGWDAPAPAPWLTAALDEIGSQVFGKPNATVGVGGGIPFIGMLAERFPAAQFVVTGAVGPDSNMHALDEFLNLPYAYRLTEAIALLLAVHAQS
ncbi:M20/M25/M40 family metallo-hydrolase [Actinoplanes sp. TBRC 11911]|uniref:M20/M25/M40 family metallo-hydrolase n=1 Tax=Actinoplanes sp. TBRC 11911 TaxID=2729386 RepID=UPI00145DF77B|nr:M20/M25/M40 family metallo-hydrolase [Actinoplanes sp. TBRC 11911]NMO55712.1 M20/M25/M40 family metallo-hydrolase [Actinoplanes sp. TBRC 11911]